jgi:transcription termination factor NusB
VNIASKYSSEKSASFVNGLLAEIVRGKDND